jgi:hypothetical protein
MAYRIKLDGTTKDVFDIGLHKGVLDFSALTTQRTLKFPDSNGVSGYVLSTDGSGNLSWVGVGASADNTTPYFIPSSETFVNNLNRQSLFTASIDVEGTLEVNGLLLEVS